MQGKHIHPRVQVDFQLRPSLTSAASPPHDNAQALKNHIHAQNPLSMKRFAWLGVVGINAILSPQLSR